MLYRGTTHKIRAVVILPQPDGSRLPAVIRQKPGSIFRRHRTGSPGKCQYSGGTEPAAQVNAKAVEVMKEVGIDISSHVPVHVDTYLDQEWDYVITVCGGANESCPAFTGKVGKRMHIGFDDPSKAMGTPEFIDSEFRRVRDEIRNAFARFYITEIRKKELSEDEHRQKL